MDYKQEQLESKIFLVSKAWKKIRSIALEIYPKICMNCSAYSNRFNVDHIYPRKYYPNLALDLNNLQILCPYCNFSKGNTVMDYRKEADLEKLREYLIKYPL